MRPLAKQIDLVGLESRQPAGGGRLGRAPANSGGPNSSQSTGAQGQAAASLLPRQSRPFLRPPSSPSAAVLLSAFCSAMVRSNSSLVAAHILDRANSPRRRPFLPRFCEPLNLASISPSALAVAASGLTCDSPTASATSATLQVTTSARDENALDLGVVPAHLPQPSQLKSR